MSVRIYFLHVCIFEEWDITSPYNVTKELLKEIPIHYPFALNVKLREKSEVMFNMQLELGDAEVVQFAEEMLKENSNNEITPRDLLISILIK